MPPLRHALALFLSCWIVIAMTAAETQPLELRSAAAIRSLTPQEAAQARPVRLRGHLLLVTAPGNAVVLLNEGEGIYVELNQEAHANLRLGDVFDVEGVSDAGDFAPIIRATRFERVDAGVLPAPRETTIAELNAGGYDAAWIEMRGIVRSCVPTPPDRMPVPRASATGPRSPAPPRESWLVTFAQGDDKMQILINGPVDARAIIDAEVRLRGVVFNVHNANRQFVRANLQVPEPSMVDVLVPPPEDAFSRPLQHVNEVLRFSRDGFSGHRVHVRGVVTGHKDGHTLWIREGEHGMRVASTQRGLLKPGEEVDVVGFPDHGSYTPSLSDAIFRRVQVGPAPVPKLLRNTDEIARHDANLVQIHAMLIDVRPSAEGPLLVLNWNGREVAARFMQSVSEDEVSGWIPGSLLRVSGICMAGQTNFLRPTGLWMAEDLQLWMRTPGDVAVLRSAPWITPQRAVIIVFTFAVMTLAALVAVALAARRQIAQREDARKLAEVEFSAMLAERNRLARDFHDTLAQDLNAVSMQLELAKNASKTGMLEPVVNFVGVAHEIVRKCLAEARESIWNMRSHILERNDLPEALRLVAEQLGAGSKCAIRCTVHGRPRRLAPAIENNLLRVGQEAVSNALKHARARTIQIDLHFEAATVRLIVRDDGVGFDPAGTHAASSHFGLRGMQERVAQMGGKIAIESAPGSGTFVEIRVDAPN